MQIHHLPIGPSGYGNVVCCFDSSRMLTQAPDLPFIEVDTSTSPELYYDVLIHPSKYLINDTGALSIDPHWDESAIV